MPIVTKKIIADEKTDRFFLSRFKRGPDCWLWLGAKTTGRDGFNYGAIRDATGKIRLAHRYSWLYHYGEIPQDLCVCHHCVVPLCVNPQHLFIGTNGDNIKDAAQKGHYKRDSEKNGNLKLIPDDIVEIRQINQLRQYTQKELGARYGVTQRLVSLIIRGEIWPEVGGPIDRTGTRTLKSDRWKKDISAPMRKFS